MCWSILVEPDQDHVLGNVLLAGAALLAKASSHRHHLRHRSA